MNEITVTAENFRKEVLENADTVIVDFWAPWCGPCRMQAPVLSEFAKSHPGVVIGKVNVDEEPDLARAFGIMSIPTLISFRNGKALKQAVGLQNESRLENLIR